MVVDTEDFSSFLSPAPEAPDGSTPSSSITLTNNERTSHACTVPMIQGPVKAAHEPLCLDASKILKHEPRVPAIDIPAAEGKVVDVAASQQRRRHAVGA